MDILTCLVIWSIVCHFQLDFAPIPENWRDYIAKEMLDKYDGKSLDGFSEEYFQGDIGGVDKGLPIDGLHGQLNNAISDDRKRWPNGVVPYLLSEIFMQEDRRLEREFIFAAMNNIAAHTGFCVKFLPRTTEQDYVYIGRGIHCRSDVGRTGGRQYIVLTRGCLEEIGAIQHELLHTLGFYHENSRADRDDYVWINWTNLQPAAAKDFKIPTDGVTFNLPYDYDSVLHYRHNAFAINSFFPTIIPKEKVRGIGQSASLSILDIVKLKRAYNCPEKEYEKAIGSLSKTTAKRVTVPDETHLPSPLPDWRKGSLGEVECKSLKTKNCGLQTSADCRKGYLPFFCNALSTWNEIQYYLERIKQALPSSPISFYLGGKKELLPEVFGPVSENLMSLQIYSLTDFSSSTLAQLQLPNLLNLAFRDCKNIFIKANTLKFSNLRKLQFVKSIIAEIEEGSFESLISLRTVVFDQEISQPFEFSTRDHLWRLHCSSEYRWLREYLKQKSDLIQPRKQGELFRVPGFASGTYTRRMIFYPVDCAEDDLTGDWDQDEFSKNAE